MYPERLLILKFNVSFAKVSSALLLSTLSTLRASLRNNWIRARLEMLFLSRYGALCPPVTSWPIKSIILKQDSESPFKSLLICADLGMILESNSYFQIKRCECNPWVAQHASEVWKYSLFNFYEELSQRALALYNIWSTFWYRENPENVHLITAVLITTRLWSEICIQVGKVMCRGKRKGLWNQTGLVLSYCSATD